MLTFLIIAVIVVAIGALLFYKVPAVNKVMRDSETVMVQVSKAIAGLVAGLFALVDPSLVQNATQTVVEKAGLSWSWPIWLLGLSLIMLAVNRFRQGKA